MKVRVLAGALMLGAIAVVLAGSAALAGNGDGGDTFRAELNGYNEVVGAPGPGTGSVSTRATGSFEAKLRDGGTKLEFTLKYSGIEGGTVTQAHPHFAQLHVAGDIFGFFCGGPKPACPTPSGTVHGTWTSADVIGPGGQGVQSGAFDKFVRALRAGAVYVNVHSTNFPEGEIRGQVRGKGNKGDNEGNNGDDNDK